MQKTMKNAVLIGSISVLMLPSIGIMTGCQQTTNIFGNGTNEIVKTVGTSKHTDDADRKDYSILQDINGNKFTTVMSVTENNGTNKFDRENFSKFLTDKNINWYQMIATNSMGTQNDESCYLFFPESISFTDLQATSDTINASGTFNATILDEKTYREYADNVNSFNFYRNETTYYGPARN